MRVHIESSLNPDILMFSCEEGFSAKPMEITRKNISERSPLAMDLFYFPFVEKVFLTGNTVAVQRKDKTDWGTVSTELRQIVNRHLLAKTIWVEDENKKPFKVAARKTNDPETMRFVLNRNMGENPGEVRAQSELLQRELKKFNYIDELIITEEEIRIRKKEEVEWKYVISDLCWYIADLLEKRK